MTIKNLENIKDIIVQIMMSANIQIHFGLQIVFVCLYITPSHYHHCANLSEDIELMKCLSDIFCRVCEYDYAYFLSYPLYNIWGCVFSVYPFPSWWLREYTLCLIIIIKSEVWIIIHCLGLGHETMVCAVCLSIVSFLLHKDSATTFPNSIFIYSIFHDICTCLLCCCGYIEILCRQNVKCSPTSFLVV